MSGAGSSTSMQLNFIQPQQYQEEDFHLEDLEDELLGLSDTYEDHVPAKLKIGRRHPDPIVETASLASVAPPEVYYQLHFPNGYFEAGLLSALQLEAIVYCCQQHDFFLESGERAGYLIGDGAGVGKGRTIAGIIYENYMCGRTKSLWVSVSADLKEDAERDLKDIAGMFIKVSALNKQKYGSLAQNPINLHDGVLFSTYSGLMGRSATGGKINTRIKQIVDWLGKDFDGLIIFDECHRAKNLCPTGKGKSSKTGLIVHMLQEELKKARVVYASATGASEPKNMGYMTRLGIWGPGTPFPEFNDFTDAVKKRGIGAMEIVAMDMKLRGGFIARQLSFKGVTLTIEEVPVQDQYKQMYDKCVKLWVEALQMFIEAAELMETDPSAKRIMWAQFWGSHQRFFKYLCIAAKVDRAISMTREALKSGKCVVIGLQSTGEARTTEQKEKQQLNYFVSTAKGVIQTLVEKQFPASERGLSSPGSSSTDESVSSDTELSEAESGCEMDANLTALKTCNRKRKALPPTAEPTKENVERVCKMKSQLLTKIENLGGIMPINSLDYLIHELGGTKHVAEMTGRKMRLVRDDQGKIKYQSRAGSDDTLEHINLTEKKKFMDGIKHIAIISEAASIGVSLQSDRRAKNTLRRVHITLELPWSADKAMLQFGRTHRSNQVNAPEYIFLISEFAGERRFAFSVAKRLESLGALTHGDRRATETRDLSRFHIENQYGKLALKSVMAYIQDSGEQLEIATLPSSDYKGDFQSDVSEGLAGVGLMVYREGRLLPHHDFYNLSKFLNRILGLRFDLQNALFNYFAETLAEIILDAKRQGRFDMGILNLDSSNKNTRIAATQKFNRKQATGLGLIELHEIVVDRGISWKESKRKYKILTDKKREGYYVSNGINAKKMAILVVCDEPCSTLKSDNERRYSIYRPNTGLQAGRETLKGITSKYYLSSPTKKIKKIWYEQYEKARSQCIHVYM